MNKQEMSAWLEKVPSETTCSAMKVSWKSAHPFPHLEIKNFLKPEKAAEVLKALAQEQFIEKESDLFKFMQTNDLAGTKNKVLKDLRSFLCSKEWVDVLQQMTGLRLKSGVVDMAGSLYQDTDFLLCHDDQLEGRKIAFMLYLSTMQESAGGSLNLLASTKGKPTGVSKKIFPQFNSLVMFEVSPISFHEVEEVIAPVQRITLGGWFHG